MTKEEAIQRRKNIEQAMRYKRYGTDYVISPLRFLLYLAIYRIIGG